MALHRLRTVVRPRSRGQITIPAAMREALGISESSLLEMSVQGDQIVIAKLADPPEATFRAYTDEELEAFLAEDQLTPETAQRVRDLLAAGLV